MVRQAIGLSFLVLFAAVGDVHAQSKASTKQLPAALLAAGVNGPSVVVTKKEAQKIRGQSGCTTCTPGPTTPPPYCPPGTGTGPHIVQQKTFTVTGTATGTVVLFEGVVGEFTHTQRTATSTTAVAGNFGGLSGYIGADATGSLQFLLEGKALQEQLTFTGAYQQTFNQVYSH